MNPISVVGRPVFLLFFPLLLIIDGLVPEDYLHIKGELAVGIKMVLRNLESSFISNFTYKSN